MSNGYIDVLKARLAHLAAAYEALLQAGEHKMAAPVGRRMYEVDQQVRLMIFHGDEE